MDLDTLMQQPGRSVAENYSRLAFDAVVRNDLAQALEYWEDVRWHDRRDERGWIQPIFLLVKLGRHEEAAAIGAQAEGEIGGSPLLSMLRASVAQRQQNWQAAATFWNRAVQAEPANTMYRASLIRALVQTGQIAEAQAAFEAAGEDARTRPEMLGAAAQIAEARTDWVQALPLWEAYANAMPQQPEGVTGVARSLCAMRRFSAADAVVARARVAFPQHLPLAVWSAITATSTHSWDEAARRWETVLALHPENPSAPGHIERCRRHAAEHAARDPQLAAMLDRFTSLGRNCEFGFLQRSLGSDRPALLRWAYTRHPALIEALRLRFAGLGSPECTEISDSQSEYRITDRRYGFGLHTFIHMTEATPEDMLRRECRRMRLLAEKLVSELDSGNRILVHQSAAMTEDEAHELHAALRGYGPNHLLCVRAARDPAEAGRHVLLEPTLMLATIRHEGLQPDQTWDICTDQWVAFIRTAHGLWSNDLPA